MAENDIIAKTNISGPGIELQELIEKRILDIDYDNLKVLDIGFNNPGSFILLHHLYGLSKYVGVDTMESNQFNINISFDHSAPIPEEMVGNGNSTPFDQYQLFHKYILGQIPGKQLIMLSKIDFERTFEFRFETFVQNYVDADRLSEYRPNLLVLSDILHLIEDKNEAHSTFTSLLEKVSEEGIIWLKVYSSRNSGNSERFPYLLSELENLKSKINCIYEHEQDGKTLIVGRKK